MLTKNDIKLLREVFATKEDLNRYALKEDLVNFKDEILYEIRSMRQELVVIIGYKDQIEDHEVRLEKLEKKI